MKRSMIVCGVTRRCGTYECVELKSFKRKNFLSKVRKKKLERPLRKV